MVLYSILLFIVSWIACGEIAFELWRRNKIKGELQKSTLAKVDAHYIFFEILPYHLQLVVFGPFSLIYVLYSICSQRKEK